MITTKNDLINKVIGSMANELSSTQLNKLENVLRMQLHGIVLQQECTEISTYIDDNEYIIKLFMGNKMLENLSDKSIQQYVNATKKLLETLNKNYKDVTTDDIKYYLAQYQLKFKVSPCTLANMKRFISAFFAWCLDEEYITRNPVHAIKNIKQPKKKKQYLTADEVESMRDVCETLRERAMLELLLDTGLRVSEVVALDIDSIDMAKGEVSIYGSKTRTWRTGYLNSKSKLHLQKYLMSRSDDNEALFVSSRRPYARLGNCTIQEELQAIAMRAGIQKHVTVHLLRKTFATNLSKNGTPIEIIQQLLGHANISVTQQNYVTVDEDEVKSYHRKSA